MNLIKSNFGGCWEDQTEDATIYGYVVPKQIDLLSLSLSTHARRSYKQCWKAFTPGSEHYVKALHGKKVCPRALPIVQTVEFIHKAQETCALTGIGHSHIRTIFQRSETPRGQ